MFLTQIIYGAQCAYIHTYIVASDWRTDVLFGDLKTTFMKPISYGVLLNWVKTGYIWFDYFSVPQSVGYDVDADDELMAAVESIPPE